MHMKLWGVVGVVGLCFGFASSASAGGQDKSWEVDVYGDEAEVTYVPDGRDDIHVYDHNNHYNDRSYIEVDPPRYEYRGGYGYQGGYDPYTSRHEHGRGGRGYGHYDGRGYGRHGYQPRRYRIEYHNRYRHW